MPVRALRFLHAANLRLDAALTLDSSIPDDLQSVLDEATAGALAGIVSAALEHDADALIITGNTFVSAGGSLSAEVTLRQEMARLDKVGLPVLITPGRLDPAAFWRELPDLPENVTIFQHGDEPGVDLTDKGRPLATILPVSAQTGVDAPELERIRSLSADGSQDRGFLLGLWIPDGSPVSEFGYASLDYLAAGTDAAGLPVTDGLVHLQAGPQGLSPLEPGGQGCQLVDVDADGRIHKRLLPVAPVRWETCHVEGRVFTDRDELCERMLARLERLAGYAGEQLRIITWPLEQTILEAVGVQTESAVRDLGRALTELTDQPKHGLRYLHLVEPVWDEASFPAAVDRELWQDFLTEMERISPVEPERLRKLWEQQTGSSAVPAGWPEEVRWPPVNPERVRRLTLQSGRRWFHQAAGGAIR